MRCHLSINNGFMSAPCGISYFKGKYHVFYLYNPDAPRWGYMHWGHAVTTDLISYEEMPIALTPDEGASYLGGSSITADGKLVLIVCDGRGSGGSKGFTLAELAAKFISLGCTDAMNLDGGGSSCIVGSDGKVLNHPSDGSERIVSSAIIISEIPHD